MRVIIGLLCLICSSLSYANPSGLQTSTENRLGITAGDYYYREPSLNVVLDAQLVGLDYSGTYSLKNQ